MLKAAAQQDDSDVYLRESGAPAASPVVLVAHEPRLRERVQTVLGLAKAEVRVYPDAVAMLDSLDREGMAFVLIEASLPGIDGLELQRELHAQRIAAPTVLIVDDADVTTAVAAVRGGALDVIERGRVATGVLTAMRKALAHVRECSRSQAECDDVRARYSQLTRREHEVLDLVVAGLPSRAIAEQLGVQLKTVELYRSRINKKMHARNAVELLRLVTSMRRPQMS